MSVLLLLATIFLILVIIISLFYMCFGKKPILLWLYSAPVCILFFIYGGLNYSGYCFEQNRWLSYEEFLPKNICTKNNALKIDDSYSHTAEDEHKKNNKEYCLYMDYSFILDKIFGLSYSYVEVQYKRHNISPDDPNKSNYYKQRMELNACGKIVNSYDESVTIN